MNTIRKCAAGLALVLVLAGASAAAPPEPLVLKDHKGWVGAVAFAPDGTLVTASAEGTVRFWDAAGTRTAALDAHDDIVSGLAFAKGGAHFATASFDGTAKVWSAERKLVHTLRAGRGAQLAVAFHPNGKTVATAGIEGVVRVWDVDTNEEPRGRFLRRHGSWANALTYKPDGTGLASVGSDNEVWFNPVAGRLMIVRPSIAEVRSVAYSRDGKWLATGTRYGSTRVWDNDGDEVATLKGKHTGDVWAVGFSPDGKWLATGDGDWRKPSDIVIWDTKTWKEVARLSHTSEVLCLAWHTTKPVLAAGAWDKTARVWDLSEGKK
ncbi:MAG: WD40 repeat domain-containing protein [Planctomycetes bacterium]|nr:WD40 repeat domain-containing protein [Planctomycetota bacterium]